MITFIKFTAYESSHLNHDNFLHICVYFCKYESGFNCGLFVCMYADFIAMDFPLHFTQVFIDKVRERMPLAILGKCSIGDTLGPDLHIPTLEEFWKNRTIIEETSGPDQDIETVEGSDAPIPDLTSTVKNVVDNQVPCQGENANNEVTDVDNKKKNYQCQIFYQPHLMKTSMLLN